MPTQETVPDGVDTSVDAVQTAAADPTLDLCDGDPDLE
jgi:hypothetical protein